MPANHSLLEPPMQKFPVEPEPGRMEASRPLLGEWLTRPWHLLWIGALPQAVLLWLNVRAWRLASGEADVTQRSLAAATLGMELVLLLGGAGLAVSLRVRRQPLGWAWNWPILAATIGYLGWAVWNFNAMQPGTVPQWIVSSSELLYYQFVLIMPLAFYAGLRLACFDSNRSLWPDVGRTVAVALCAVGVALAAGQAARWWRWLDKVPIFLIVAGLLTLTLLLLGALMRTLALTYVEVRNRGPAAMAALVVVVGIAGPLGGLALNRTIPCPADFQTWQVYALALVNGLLLLLPNHRHPLVHRLVWLGQCATFSFTLYFFLVFLPVLPFCLPAMFWFGAGMLLIVPSALFVVHLQRLVDGYRHEARDGRPWVPALLGIGAACMLPAFYVGGAALDRVVLLGALDYAYTPSYRADAKPFAGSRSRVESSLEHLRDFKAGKDLPFLTDLYKGIVFGGLVLPDEKMRHVYQVFTGREMPPADEGRMSIFGHNETTRGGRGREREAAPRFVDASTKMTVVLNDLAQTITTEGPCERTHLTLTMKNNSAEAGEFVTQVHLPEAARVTGFWLHVGTERVPGRLVERKTALWVYHRIRDAAIRRDPGLLSYTGPETVELRVYPFKSYEQRTAEIELLYPAAVASSIRVGDRALTSPEPSATEAETIVLTPAGKAGMSVTLPLGALAKLPTVTRRPCLHFLLDRSADSDVDLATLQRAIQTAVEHFPVASEVVLTTVNYECQEPLSAEPMPVSTLLSMLADNAAFERRLPPLQGGFLQERALRRGLVVARDRLARARGEHDPALESYPVFIVVRGSHTQAVGDSSEIGGPGSGGSNAFAALVPEENHRWLMIDGGRTLATYTLDAAAAKVVEIPPAHPVVLLHCDDETVACVADSGHAETVRFLSSNLPTPARPFAFLSAYDPNARAFQDCKALRITQVPADAAYARATEVSLRYHALVEDPSPGNAGLARLAALSRALGVLTGATSYIVVENSAQWKILEQKERQKLANAPALEIEQTPEPGTWVMIVLGGMGMIVYARRRNFRVGTALRSRP